MARSRHPAHSGGVATDPFAVLGLAPTASEAQVKAAYRAAARRLHPDAGGDEAAFRELAAAAKRAGAYASGAVPNPYLPSDEHALYVDQYDRHAHSPAPPPDIWGSRRALFWILPVAGAIFMLAGATGPYFLPVWLASMAVFAVVVWVAVRR
jgi:hypothetical protein